MRQTTNPHPEVLVFRQGSSTATVVTDGQRFATYHPTMGRRWHRRLSAAIAHLEQMGFNIQTDEWPCTK